MAGSYWLACPVLIGVVEGEGEGKGEGRMVVYTVPALILCLDVCALYLSLPLPSELLFYL